MVKRVARNQISGLLPNHKNLKNKGQFMTFKSITYDKKLKCIFKGYHVDL